MNTKISTRKLSRPSRRGSVLILVVALLVLMALIGTAWISTARVDRAASIGTTHVTEIELTVDGVINMAKAALVDDVSGGGALRGGAGYVPGDSTVTDAFMASRLPVFVDEVAALWSDVPAAGYADPPMYEKGRIVRVGASTGRYYICRETHRARSGDAPGSSNKWYELGSYDVTATNPQRNPIFWPATSRVQPAEIPFEDITGTYAGFTQRTGMAPTSVSFNGRQYPAFSFFHVGLGIPVTVVAADADGDGIADSNYFKLPIGRVNGLDYYAAVRIVDNNSAVNASVAFAPGGDDDKKIADFPSSLSIGNLLFGKDVPELNDQANRLEHAVANDNPNDDLAVPILPINYAGYNAPVNDQSSNPRVRGDFVHPDIDEGGIPHLRWMVRGRRLGNPGYWTDNGTTPIRMKALPSADGAALAYRGGTLLNIDAMTSVPPFNGSSLIEQLLGPTLYSGADNHPDASGTNLNGAYRVDVGRRSAYPETVPAAWQELFARNYDWFERWVPNSAKETSTDRSTYLNRRSLMTVSNPVSNAVPSRLKPRNGFPGSQVPGVWNSDLSYDVGDYVTFNGLTYVCLSPIPAGLGLPPGTINPGLGGDHPARTRNWEPRPFDLFPTKASANAGSFGQLYLAFWQTMAENASLKRPPTPPTGNEPSPPQQQTPFKDAFRLHSVSVPADMDNPYFGGQFTRGALGVPTPLFPPYSATGGIDQHPLRMFRSLIRAVPPTTATATNAFGAATPRIMVDHTMRLRAALAAVNAIDMRDSDDNVTARDINIGITLNRGASGVLETEATDQNVIGRVKVYGHERQPFITEIFAQTDTGDTSDGANPYGYVAVELYNPYPFHIDIRYCKIATIDRTPGNVRNLVVSESAVPAANAALAPSLANAESNVSATTNPWLIPANGFLVLENFDAPEGGAVTGSPNPPTNILPAAVYRPVSSGLPVTGSITPAGATPHNYTYVPNLHKVLDKEMVLLRPLNAEAMATGLDWLTDSNVTALRYVEPPTVAAYPGTPAVDMAPLDSYDFTGLHNPDGAALTRSPTPRLSPTHAYAWHYARPYLATAAPGTTKAWRFVYPGRYDGFQTLQATRGPRQQGTQEAGAGSVPGWDPAGGAGGLTDDPWKIAGALLPGMTLSDLVVTGLNNQATYHPYEYAIQLTNSLGITDGAAGPNPIRSDTGNKFPFGGFARNGDVLQIPYIGSYRIKITAFNVPPARPTPAPPGVVSQISRTNPLSVTTSEYNQVLELNAITMDSVFAEDTDPFNHYNTTTPPTDWTLIPPEQIGRFTPSRFDLEIGAAGTVDSASFTVNDPTNPPNTGTLDDAERNEPGNPWSGHDLEIVDGPGKGQTRPVVNFSGGTFTVYPDWEVQPTSASRYVLRRGTLWVPAGGGMIRTSGNKYWASDVLEYVTADSPQDDYLPAADPASYDRGGAMLPPQSVANADASKPGAISYGWKTGGSGLTIQGTANLSDLPNAYTGGWIEMLSGNAAGEVRAIDAYDAGSRTVTIAGSFDQNPASNDRFRIFARDSEDLTGTQGLVNINTAPWKVLAQIPWTRADDVSPAANAGAVAAANALLAQKIAAYRDGDPSAGIAPHGPFRTLFDLYRVPDFFYHQRLLLLRVDPGNTVGDNMPRGGVDNVRFDFEEQYLLLNRVSNMITTKSDSFTAYVLVQGWRGAGTANPELVVQRRRAFTADRTGLTPTNKELPIQYLYND